MTTQTLEENQQKILDWKFTRRQTMAFRLLSSDQPEVAEVLYGGAKGGGKSVLGVRWCLDKCDELIEQFDLKPTKFPPVAGFMGRKHGVDFSDTTMETLKREWPPDRYEIKEQAKEIIIDGCIKIAFGGFDSTEAVNKFNSAEFVFAFIDQAEELSLDDAGLLRGAMRGKIAGKDPVRKILWTANPRRCWLKNEFIDRQKTNVEYRFVQALPTDNHFLPTNYIHQLEKAFGHRPELLAAYRDGSWEAFEDPCQIILERDINDALLRRRVHSKSCKFIVIDPARYGDAESVLYLFENTDLIDQKIFGKIRDDKLNLEAHAWAIKEEVEAVVIDEGGLGGPIVDWQRNLAGEAYQVIGLNSASAADDKETYFNLRAEMWMTVSRMFADGEIFLSTTVWMSEDDWRILVNQLCAVLYDFRGKKIIVESKEDLKKPDRLGCSPDRADTAIMAWYIYKRIKRRKTKPASRGQRAYRQKMSRTAMAS